MIHSNTKGCIWWTILLVAVGTVIVLAAKGTYDKMNDRIATQSAQLTAAAAGGSIGAPTGVATSRTIGEGNTPTPSPTVSTSTPEATPTIESTQTATATATKVPQSTAVESATATPTRTSTSEPTAAPKKSCQAVWHEGADYSGFLLHGLTSLDSTGYILHAQYWVIGEESTDHNRVLEPDATWTVAKEVGGGWIWEYPVANCTLEDVNNQVANSMAMSPAKTKDIRDETDEFITKD